MRYETRARRDLRRLDPPVRIRILESIDKLTRDPAEGSGLRRLRGRPELRLRVGDWRVILEIDRAEQTITVLRALPRSRAYDR